MLNKRSTLSLSAASVIAALALGSAPVVAQEAAPVIDLPPAAGAPPPSAPVVQQPTIVLPEATAPAPQPVAEAPPAPTRAETPVRQSSSRAAAPARQAASAPPARTEAPAAAPEAVTPAVAPIAAVPVAAADLAPAPAPITPPPAPVERDTGLGAEAGLLALLAALGLGGAGLLAARSRRRREVMSDEDAVMLESAAVDPVLPMAASPSMPAYSMYEAVPEPAPQPRAEIPAGPIPRGEERDALLRRMIAAEPDEANPFRSRKARLRRARLILQREEHERQVAGQDAGFDWRTYRPSRVDARREPVTV